MQKIYTKELRPTPVPLTVPGEAIDDEDVCSFSILNLWFFSYSWRIVPNDLDILTDVFS